MSQAVDTIVIGCCAELVGELLKSDIGIPVKTLSDTDYQLLINTGLARIDVHRGIKVLKATTELFNRCCDKL